MVSLWGFVVVIIYISLANIVSSTSKAYPEFLFTISIQKPLCGPSFYLSWIPGPFLTCLYVFTMPLLLSILYQGDRIQAPVTRPHLLWLLSLPISSPLPTLSGWSSLLWLLFGIIHFSIQMSLPPRDFLSSKYSEKPPLPVPVHYYHILLFYS